MTAENTGIEHVTSPLAARRIGTAGRSVVIHAAEGWLQPLREGNFDFFTKLAPRLTKEGLSTRLVAAGGTASKVLLSQRHVHIMVGAKARYGPGVLHAMPSYIWGFWYFDEIGAYHNSSLRLAKFYPEKIKAEDADYFFNGVTGYMLRENVSKSPQEERVNQPVQQAAAVVYCQELDEDADRCHYLDTEEMIRTTAATFPDDLVYVKPHPNQTKVARRRIIEVAKDYTNIRMSEASVHDLTEASGVVVTQNSAAGFEALMQRKPVITCAKSDFWHATLTPRNKDDLVEALKFGGEAMAEFEYEKYFYWFLSRNCLEPQKENFANRAWARIRDKVIF